MNYYEWSRVDNELLLTFLFSSSGEQELDRLERTLLADSAIDTEFSGSTAVFAAVRDRQLHVCNVGDSRIIVGRSIGGGKLQAFDVSNDHKPDLEAEKARIVATGGRVFAVEVSTSMCCSASMMQHTDGVGWGCVTEGASACSGTVWSVSPPPPSPLAHALFRPPSPPPFLSPVRGRCVGSRPCVAG